MSKIRTGRTAGEITADPEFQERQAETYRKLAERQAAFAVIERPIMDELRKVGVAAASVDEMVKGYAPLSPQIVQVLLDWLPRVQEDRIKESMIRALGAAKEPFDGRPLADCFMHDTSETLRWPIANSMAIARPLEISDWLVEAVKNRLFGSARQMLVLALAKLTPRETSLPVLLSVLDELPGHVAKALAGIGGAAELSALKSRVDSVQGPKWIRNEMLKAIRKIEKRLRNVREKSGET
ncbi:MAG: hypothetical protein ACLQNE_46215 [Thermoguttaceae bacterium]